MQIGAFMMPSHPPERGIREGLDWDIKQLALLDRLGFNEAWIGEHYTEPWEPCPAPDLLIAEALISISLDPTHTASDFGNGFADHFKVDPSDADSNVTVDDLVEKSWFVGSTRTVIHKLGKLQHHTGGFGSLLVMLYDFSTEQGAWEDSLHRLVEEVVPEFS